MIDPADISTMIARGSQYRGQLAIADLALEHSGCRARWKSICLSNLIQALTYLYNAGDYTSLLVTTIYDKMATMVGGNALTVNTINPNAQFPINSVIVSGAYVSPDNTIVSLLGVSSPYQYTYSGNDKIKGAYAEMFDSVQNKWIETSDVQIARNGTAFTFTGIWPATEDNYRVQIITG